VKDGGVIKPQPFPRLAQSRQCTTLAIEKSRFLLCGEMLPHPQGEVERTERRHPGAILKFHFIDRTDLCRPVNSILTRSWSYPKG
jgi:hypothetical protein